MGERPAAGTTAAAPVSPDGARVEFARAHARAAPARAGPSCGAPDGPPRPRAARAPRGRRASVATTEAESWRSAGRLLALAPEPSALTTGLGTGDACRARPGARARDRWRFSLGCARASALIRRATVARARRSRPARRRLAGVPVAATLAAYGLIRYPGLRSDPHAWAAMAGFLALVLAYAALAMALARGTAPRAAAAHRWGLAAGLVTGAAWYVALAPPPRCKGRWVLIPPARRAARARRPPSSPPAPPSGPVWSAVSSPGSPG